MHKYRMKDPSGEWIETLAPSLRKAKQNFIWRLQRAPYGMFVLDAQAFVDSVEEIPE